MLTVERIKAPKTQRETGKGTDYIFKCDGIPILEINKRLYYHLTRWPTDLLPEEAAQFKVNARKK